ncbi:MAG: DNA/RNA non-specific endonuclease [Gammaproteobacteria bacterium]|nr:DNA/RNA non-specific endonuclease [Gammaproteobacteria bacterium]
MNKYFAASIIISGMFLPIKADILSVHCPLGCPSNPAGNDLIFGHVYALSNNPETKFADWVAYEVSVLNFGVSPGRSWKSDPLLEDSETLEKSDYGNVSSIDADRGHQAPLASFAGSHYWHELNYLSNITPQHKNLNQGPWKNLEDAVRSAVEFRKSLFVVTGTIYDNNTLKLPNANEDHEIPTGYFKIIYNLEGEAASFLMEQSTPRNTNFCSKQQAISAIKAKVGFELPTLSNSMSLAANLGC